MPASLRIELFPAAMDIFLDFYTRVLDFKLIQRKGTYVYLKRDNIYIGAVETPTVDSPADRRSYRQPNKGVEIVIEVDDVQGERDRVLELGYKLDADLERQKWGLEDFRLTDPDGYYIRITNRSEDSHVSER